MKKIFILLFTFASLQSCKKEQPTSPKIAPTLTISEILNADVTFTSIVVNGAISPEKETVVEYGVCYGINPDPKISDNKLAATTNAFKAEIKDLAVNTKYYFRTYITTNKETIYSNTQISKNTLSLAGTTWDFVFTFNPANPSSPSVTWNGDVTFNANGTTKYDEPASPGLYLMNGTYAITGNSIDYKMGPPSDPGYALVGKVNGNKMSGTFNGGSPTKPNTWTATPKK